MEKRIDIWQLKDSDEADERLFRSYESIKREFGSIDPRMYEHIYTGMRSKSEATPDSIYWEFNCNHPADFDGHSLSVSDIVQITEEDGSIRTLYVNDLGFIDIDAELAARLGKE